MQGHFKKKYMKRCIDFYPVNIFYVLYHLHLFLTELFQYIYIVLCACVVNTEVKQEVTLTAPMINDTYTLGLWYTLYFPYAVFFCQININI